MNGHIVPVLRVVLLTCGVEYLPSVQGLGSCLAHLSGSVVPGAVKKPWVQLTRRRLAPPPLPLAP